MERPGKQTSPCLMGDEAMAVVIAFPRNTWVHDLAQACYFILENCQLGDWCVDACGDDFEFKFLNAVDAIVFKMRFF
jgi:hypothetical protein